MKKTIGFFILFLLASQTYSQLERHNVRLYVQPGDQFRVKINGDLQPEANKFYLEPGKKYKFQVWAPHYHIFDTSIVASNEVIIIPKILIPKDEYIAFQKKQEQYGLHKKQMVLGAVSTFGIATMSFFNYGEVGRRKLDVIIAEDAERFNIGRQTPYDLKQSRTRYAVAQTFQIFSYFATAGLGYYTYTRIKKMKETKPQKLEEDKRFIVESVGLGYTQQSGYQFSTLIKF